MGGGPWRTRPLWTREELSSGCLPFCKLGSGLCLEEMSRSAGGSAGRALAFAVRLFPDSRFCGSKYRNRSQVDAGVHTISEQYSCMGMPATYGAITI